MEKKIAIQMGDARAVITLYWDSAPNICRQIWNLLPVEVPAHHAKVVNNEIIFPLPGFIERDKESYKLPGKGSVGWWDSRMCVNIWYKDTHPLGTTGLFGYVSKGLEALAAEGEKLLKKQGTIVKLSKIEG